MPVWRQAVLFLVVAVAVLAFVVILAAERIVMRVGDRLLVRIMFVLRVSVLLLALEDILALVVLLCQLTGQVRGLWLLSDAFLVSCRRNRVILVTQTTHSLIELVDALQASERVILALHLFDELRERLLLEGSRFITETALTQVVVLEKLLRLDGLLHARVRYSLFHALVYLRPQRRRIRHIIEAIHGSLAQKRDDGLLHILTACVIGAGLELQWLLWLQLLLLKELL